QRTRTPRVQEGLPPGAQALRPGDRLRPALTGLRLRLVQRPADVDLEAVRGPGDHGVLVVLQRPRDRVDVRVAAEVRAEVALVAAAGRYGLRHGACRRHHRVVYRRHRPEAA